MIGTPLIDRLLMIELPLPAAPNTCDACAITESAEMPIPATVRFKAASEDSESTWSGQLIVAAFMPARVPVSASVVGVGFNDPSRLVAARTVARTPAASPTTVCAALTPGHRSNRPTIMRATAAEADR